MFTIIFVYTIIVMKDIVPNKNIIARNTIIACMKSGNWVHDRIAEVLKEHDLSLQQFNVLRILRGQKGQPANLNTIQEHMIAKMSNTTRLVDKLLLKKLVARNVCEKNRRKVEIFITEKGLQLLTILDPIITTTEQKIVAIYTPEELQTLNTLLNKLRTQ